MSIPTPHSPCDCCKWPVLSSPGNRFAGGQVWVEGGMGRAQEYALPIPGVCSPQTLPIPGVCRGTHVASSHNPTVTTYHPILYPNTCNTCPTDTMLLSSLHFSSYTCHCIVLTKHEPALHLIVRNSTATFIEADRTLFTFSGDGSISGIHPLRSDNVTWPDNVPSSHPGHLFPLHNSRNLGI